MLGCFEPSATTKKTQNRFLKCKNRSQKETCFNQMSTKKHGVNKLKTEARFKDLFVK